MEPVVGRRRSSTLLRRRTEGTRPIGGSSNSYASEFRRLASSSSTPTMRGNLAQARRGLLSPAATPSATPKADKVIAAVRSPSRPQSASAVGYGRSPSKGSNADLLGYGRSPSKGSNADLNALVDFSTQSLILSRRMNLDFHEVKFALKELHAAETREDGSMGHSAFRHMLQRVFDVSHVADELLESAYNDCKAGEGPLPAERFLCWYRDNMFTFVNAMTASGDAYQSHVTVQELARKFGTSPVELDRVKAKFDLFDLDKSGLIEYDEFEQMMFQLLNCSSKSDLPKNRMLRFWSEIDRDGSGSVDFEEFTQWWLKYFALSDQGGPIQAFYASFMPDVQRANTVLAEEKKELEAAAEMQRRQSLMSFGSRRVRTVE
eukprot:gb/GFBE01023897.1/.p1 GENE.gb/GFBE01023897.1/~~gb/GFBE01023897.1/.p1  ORF type:complete len:376 (+),score=67.46 gb/GFBE01023897.1/:1-1128(+)